jgi:hypothetical protein
LVTSIRRCISIVPDDGDFLKERLRQRIIA